MLSEVDGGDQVYLVEKMNFILQTAMIHTTVKSLVQLRSIAPLLFMKIYCAFYGPVLGMIHHPSASDHHKNNMVIFLSAMRERFSSHFLDKINAHQIVDGSVHALEVVVDMLYGACQHTAALQEKQARNSNNVDKIDKDIVEDFRKVKDTAQNLKSNKVIKKYFTKQREENSKYIPPDIKVLMDRLIVLENLNQSLPQEELAKAKKKKNKTTLKKKPQLRSGRAKCYKPLFQGRKPSFCSPGVHRTSADTEKLNEEYKSEKEVQEQNETFNNDGDSFDNLDLLYDNEKLGNEMSEECNSMDLLYESEKPNNITESNENSPINNREAIIEAERRESVNEHIAPKVGKEHYDDEDAKNDDPPLHTQVSDGGSFDKSCEKSNCADTNINILLVPILSRGGVVSYRSPFEREEYHYHNSAMSPSSKPITMPKRPHSANSYKHCKNKKLSKLQVKMACDESAEGARANDDEYVYDANTGRKVSKQDLINMQQIQDDMLKKYNKMLEKKNAPPVVPVVASYPNFTTEASVRIFNEKMEKIREKLSKEKESPTKESNHHHLEAQHLGIYKYLEECDILISVESCCNCDCHQTSLRHSEGEYVSKANSTLRHAVQVLYDLRPSVRIGICRINVNSTNKRLYHVSNTRIGAFEIQVAYKDSAGFISYDLLHSKLMSTRWPSKTVVEKRLKAFLTKQKMQYMPTTQTNGANEQDSMASSRHSGRWSDLFHNDDNKVENKSLVCNSAGWDELSISQKEWNYPPESESVPIWIINWKDCDDDEGNCTLRTHNITMDRPEGDIDMQT